MIDCVALLQNGLREGRESTAVKYQRHEVGRIPETIDFELINYGSL